MSLVISNFFIFWLSWFFLNSRKNDMKNFDLLETGWRIMLGKSGFSNKIVIFLSLLRICALMQNVQPSSSRHYGRRRDLSWSIFPNHGILMQAVKQMGMIILIMIEAVLQRVYRIVQKRSASSWAYRTKNNTEWNLLIQVAESGLWKMQNQNQGILLWKVETHEQNPESRN